MTSIDGAGGANALNFNHDPIPMDEVNPNLAHHIENVEGSYLDRIADLQEQIADVDNPQQKLALENELMRLEGAFDQLRDDIESLTAGNQDSLISNMIAEKSETYASQVNENLSPQLEEVLGNFRQELSASYAEFGTAQVPADVEAEKPDHSPVSEAVANDVCGEDAYVDKPDQGVEEAAEDVKESGEKMEIDEMMDLLQNDPDAFMDAMSDMDAEDRQGMMLAVQNQLQQINQLFSMATQFSQAMHETSKAVIQNLRV